MDALRLVDQEDLHKSKLPHGQQKPILSCVQKYNAAHAQTEQALWRDMNIQMEAGLPCDITISRQENPVAAAIGWTARRCLTSIVLTTTRLEPVEGNDRTKYFMINLHERMLPTQRGSNPQPPNHQLDTHPTEPPRPAFRRRQFAWNVKSCFLGKIRKIPSICWISWESGKG